MPVGHQFVGLPPVTGAPSIIPSGMKNLSLIHILHVDPAHRAEYTFRTFADEAYRLRLERKALGACLLYTSCRGR